MESVRFTQLEQRLAQVEEELRQATTRSRHLAGLTSMVAACGLVAVLAITGGAATAAPGPQELTVKAPFVVENDAGQTVFRVGLINGSGQARLFDNRGRVLVALQTNKTGTSGEVAVAGANPGQIARLGTYAGGATLGLRFYQGDTALGIVGASARGGLLMLADKAGTPMARVYNNGTSGTVGIYNAEGKTKALLATDPASGEAEFDLFYADGTTPAVQLSEVAAGGYFAVTNRAGIARVQAGTLPSDQGIVRVYGPGGFDYIRGRK